MDKGFWKYLTSGDAVSAVEGMDEPMFAIQARKNIDKGNYKEAEAYRKNGSAGVATGLAVAALPYILPELAAGSGYAGTKLITDPNALKILLGKIPAWLKHLYSITTGATTAYETANFATNLYEANKNDENDVIQERAIKVLPTGIRDSLDTYIPRNYEDSLAFLNRLDTLGRYSPKNVWYVYNEHEGNRDSAKEAGENVVFLRKLHDIAEGPDHAGVKRDLDWYKNYTSTPVLEVIPDTKEDVKVIKNSPEVSKARKTAAPFLYGAHEFSNWWLNYLTPWGLLGGSK